MIKAKKHCYSAIALSGVLCVSAAVSSAQATKKSGSIDPFEVLPPSDALLVLDLQRLTSDMVPRLLTSEPDARALVIAVSDPKTIQLLDPRAIQRLVVGFRYHNPQDPKSPSDFDVIAVAQTSEAGQLPTLIHDRGSGKYREVKYGGKVLYITQLEQAQQKPETPGTTPDDTEWAIVAIDDKTLAFGSPTYVRSSIDGTARRGTRVNAELEAATKTNPKSLLSAAGQLPTALISASQELRNSDLTQMLSSLKGFHASIELIPTGLEVTFTVNTTSPEQSKSLVDVIGALKTLAVSVGPAKTRQDRAARDLLKSLVMSVDGTELQMRAEITQANVDELAKEYGARVYFSQGLAESQRGDFKAAIAEYDKSIMLEPENANAFINRGKARSDKGDLDAAIADYDRAISLDPDNALAFNDRCFVRLKKKDFDAAIVDCNKAIALDPSLAFAYNNRGFAFASQGNLDKAIPDFDRSIAFDGENIFAYQNRGDARIRIGNFDGAIADFEKCITINAQSVEAYNGRGLARYYEGEVDQALADFNHALSLNPKAAVAYNNRALALTAKGKLDQALADYDRSIAINDRDYLVYFNRGSLRNQKDDLNGAIADFDKAIAINPKSADAFNGRGLTHYYQGNLDQALDDYDRAIAINPNFAEAYGNRALCLLALSRDAQAEQDLKKCFALNEALRSVFEPLVKEAKKTRHTKVGNRH